MNATQTGALILGNEYQALGLLRQLARAGIPCALVDHDAWGPALFSRYSQRFHQSPAYTSSDFWPWLHQLGKEQGYAGWVVIPTDDEQVRQLAEHYDEVLALYRYGGLPWDVYQQIYDKRQADGFSRRLGVGTPRTFVPLSRDGVPDGALPYPAIVKPAIKRTFSRYSKKKAIRVESAGELTALLSGDLAAVPIDELLYQEIIPGDGRYQWSYAGLFANGEPLAAFTACRRRQHPPDFGRASTYVIARHDPEVEETSRAILRELRYTGLAEVEWKRDPRDGKLKFLEVNARCWGWHSLAAQVVGNLPKMLYQFLTCGDAQTASPVYGSRWVKWVTDVPVAADLLRHGHLNWRDYLRSVRGNVVSCDWDRRDPAPFFLQLGLLPYLIAKRGY